MSDCCLTVVRQVIVTEDGIENMTHVPRTVEDVEAVMAGVATAQVWHVLISHWHR